MNEQAPDYSAAYFSPMPGRTFQKWLKLWHTIYLGGLAISLGLSF